MRLSIQLFFVLMFISLSCYPQVSKKLPIHFEAKVIKIFDGDTFEAVYKDSIYKFRLFDIDAPEYGQEFYEESKQMLTDLTNATFVLIENKGEDRYGRILSIVQRKTDSLNINREIVRQGLAWNYTQFSTDTLMPRLEGIARENQRGIWSSYHYLEPWEYRKNH